MSDLDRFGRINLVVSNAGIVIDGIAHERFLINTHPWVLEKFAVKARDYDEYISMMRAGRAAELAKSAG